MDKRILMLSGATLACALGIGFFMQQSIPPRALDAPTTSALSAQDLALEAVDVPAEPETGAFKIENMTLTSVLRSEEVQGQDTVPAPADDALVAPPDSGCSLSVTAAALPDAMVDLSASAPCQAGKRLTIHHSGMMFTAALDAAGLWHQQVPALASTAVFIVEPENGLAEVAAVSVPDLAGVNRIVLQWSGDSGFEIHARENGAEYGAPGHVWHGSDPAVGAGQLVRLGDERLLAPRMVEIYSLPRDAAEIASVDMSVETEITQINCGRQIDAQTLSLGHRI